MTGKPAAKNEISMNRASGSLTSPKTLILWFATANDIPIATAETVTAIIFFVVESVQHSFFRIADNQSNSGALGPFKSISLSQFNTLGGLLESAY